MILNSSISAVVTGGTSGLGAAVARMLVGHGVRVAVIGRNQDKGEAAANQIGALFCRADVGNDEEIARALTRARQAHGQERILVTCAGISGSAKIASRDRKTGEARRFPPDLAHRILRTNLEGTFNCVAQSAEGMLELPALDNGERGVIINTASIAASDGLAGQSAYAASKAGVTGMTLAVARDLSNDGIRCNSILPGLFDTPLSQRAPQHARDALAAQVPFPKRFGLPDEFAQVVKAVITCSYVNGENIRLDGAIRLSPR